MQIDKALEMLKELNRMKTIGGKRYSQISKIFESDATTHNIKKAEELLESFKKENK